MLYNVTQTLMLISVCIILLGQLGVFEKLPEKWTWLFVVIIILTVIMTFISCLSYIWS